MQLVKVTRFKESGKFYDEFNIDVESKTWYDIVEEIRMYWNERQNVSGSEMIWLIGMDDSRDDMYPVLIK